MLGEPRGLRLTLTTHVLLTCLLIFWPFSSADPAVSGSKRKPKFDGRDDVYMSVPVGMTVVLECHVNDLGTHSVRWFSDIHESTIFKGERKFSPDRRLMLMREPATHWDLVIHNIEKSDKGLYTCVIDTTPPISRKLDLNVKDSHCTEDEFPCQDEECVPLIKQCDGHRDCNDSSDEDFCDRCGNVTCENGGTNVASNNSTRCCQCIPGVTGANCQECDTDGINCNDGTLPPRPTNGTCACQCNERARGKYCQITDDYLGLPKRENCIETRLNVFFVLDTDYNSKDYMFKFVKHFIDLKPSGPGLMYAGLITLNNNTRRPLQPITRYEELISPDHQSQKSQFPKARADFLIGKILSDVYFQFLSLDTKAEATDLVILVIGDKPNLRSAVVEAKNLIHKNVRLMVVTPEVTQETVELAGDAVIPVGPFSEFSSFEAAQKAVLAICMACDKGWYHIGNSCYRLFNKEDVTEESPKPSPKSGEGIRWRTAERKCQKYDSQLISINTKEERNFVQETLLSDFNGYIHIGLKRDDGKIHPMYKTMFRWLDGKPPVHTKWATADNCRDSTLINSIAPCWDRSDHNHEEKMYRQHVANRCGAWKLTPGCNGDVNIGCEQPLGDGFICETLSRSRNNTMVPLMIPPTPVDGIDATGFFKCESGEFISLSAKCDRRYDCGSHDDELNCPGCESPDFFNCSDGSCIPIGLYCNFIKDCPDGEDEDCVHPKCPAGKWQCANKQCIPHYWKCNFFIDCMDGSDEEYCEDGFGYLACYDGSFYPRYWRCDGIVDCPGPELEDEESCENVSRYYLPCGPRPRHVFNIIDACNGNQDCPNGFDETEDACNMALTHNCTWNPNMVLYRRWRLETRHLEGMEDRNCSNVNCSHSHLFKCPGAYCIPPITLCNGVIDCPNGEDEAHCDTVICPGFFRCANHTYCIDIKYINKGHSDLAYCPLKDGRSYYSQVCSGTNCSCSYASITCSDSFLLENTIFHDQTRKINISNIDMKGKSLKGLHYIAELILTSCSLRAVPPLHDLWNLLLLDLSYNQISLLTESDFAGLSRLRFLYLNNNRGLRYLHQECFGQLTGLTILKLDETSVTEINQSTFSGLSSLNQLSVAHTKLTNIHDGAFRGLDNLQHLILKGNPHVQFQKDVFEGVSKLKRLETDNFYLCCKDVRPISLDEYGCRAPNNGLSSCEDLMQTDTLKFFVWILSSSALIGNAMSLCYRWFYDKASLARGYGVFVSNLGVSDFIMGVYMMIIAVADTLFRGEYMWKDYDWRHSRTCQLAGFLSTLSCEASTFFICLITLDRFLVIKYPFGTFKFKRTSSIVVSLVVWLVCLLVASIPLLPTFAHWKIYTRSSVCLALPLMDIDTDSQKYSFVVFIGINFMAFLLIAAGQAAIYKSMRSGSVVKGKVRNSQDMAIARKLSLIAITDFICWFPICVMGIMAAAGISIPRETYAWTAVFVLPINSAINPFLYTFLSAVQRKVNRMRGSNVGRREETDTGTNPTVPKVTLGFPDSNLVSLREFFDKEVATKNDLVKCLGQVILCLPKLQVCQKDHQPLTICMDNIFVTAKGKLLEQVCFSVEEDKELDIEEDAIAVMDFIKIWSDAHGQAASKESLNARDTLTIPHADGKPESDILHGGEITDD